MTDPEPSPNPTIRGTWVRWTLAIVWGLALMLLTLVPGPHPPGSPTMLLGACLVCGERGLADALLNVALFVPFGLLVGVRMRPLPTMLIGVVASGVIESLQLFVPGRFTNLGDLVTNGCGAALGALLVLATRRWLDEPRPRSVVPVAAALPVACLFAAGALMTPVRSEGPYMGRWTPEVRFRQPYAGRVLEATLGGDPVPDGPLWPSVRPDRALNGDLELAIRMIKGPPPRRGVPVVRVGGARDTVMIGVDGEDLIYGERTRALAIGLDYANVHLSGGLASYALGDTVDVAASRSGGDLCMRVEALERCGLGLSPARTWSLLVGGEHAPRTVKIAFDLFWMACLFLPIGLFGGPRRFLAAALAAGALTLLCVVVTPLVAPTWSDPSGAVLGLMAGLALRPFARAFVRLEA